MFVKSLNSKKQIIISNQINEARFKMSKAEQKLFLYCIGVVNNKNDVLNTTFEMSVKDFADFLDLKRKDMYSGMAKTTYDMATRVIEFIDQKSQLIQMPVLSKVIYKKGSVELKVNSELAPYLIDLKAGFTKYSLSEVLTLKSTYSMRLYQILCQWEYKQEVTYTVEKLRFMLNIEPLEYKLYGDFKRYVLEAAFKEINKSSTLKFSYKEVKTGRKITDIVFTIQKPVKPSKELIVKAFIPPQFDIKDKTQKEIVKASFDPLKLLDKDISELNLQTEIRLLKLGFSKANLVNLVRNFGLDYIIFALDKSKVETRSKIDNKAGYFQSVIGTLKDEYQEKKDKEKIELEDIKLYQELREKRDKEARERQVKFELEQEELCRDILENEPAIFCREVYHMLDIFVDLNIGYMRHPDYWVNKNSKNQSENIKIAKEIRNKLRNCQSLRDFRNIVKYDEEWIFTAVLNEPEQFDKNNTKFYKNNNFLKKVIIPFSF